MGQFKPMVKMMTTEPSVILKLKKGGNVHSKMATGGMAGHKAMHCEPADFEAAEHGKAPKKPSMADRRKAMNPNQYAKGGKVAHKQMGGMMPGAAMPAAPAAPMAGGMAGGMRSPMSAMSPTALAAMPASARMSRAAKVRRALTGMKKGGSTSADCAKLEKELKHHESMSASKAHGMASGGIMKKASGGIIMSKTGKTKMVTAKKGMTGGTTGEVKDGAPGGYKSGGGVRMGNAGGFAKGGNVDWENRPANTAKPGMTNTTTGGVKKANGGGYSMGGLAAKKAYATGGTVDTGKPVAMPSKPVSKPIANTMQSGTFKKGGNVKKFADGDAVIDSETRRMQTEKEAQKKENQAMRESILGVPKRMYEGVKGLFASKPELPAGKPELPAGSVTKTEKSVTVAPKRRGGRAMC
jgi:hypothetical protein